MLIMITWYCSYSWLDTTMLKSNTVIARPAPNNGYCAVCIANNWRIIVMLKMLEIFLRLPCSVFKPGPFKI